MWKPVCVLSKEGPSRGLPSLTEFGNISSTENISEEISLLDDVCENVTNESQQTEQILRFIYLFYLFVLYKLKTITLTTYQTHSLCFTTDRLPIRSGNDWCGLSLPANRTKAAMNTYNEGAINENWYRLFAALL